MFEQMIWQDIVFTVGNLIFAAALFPSIISKDKPSLYTSVPTGIVLFSFFIAFYTLSLTYSAILTLINSILWSILAVQKMGMFKAINIHHK